MSTYKVTYFKTQWTCVVMDPWKSILHWFSNKSLFQLGDLTMSVYILLPNPVPNPQIMVGKNWKSLLFYGEKLILFISVDYLSFLGTLNILTLLVWKFPIEYIQSLYVQYVILPIDLATFLKLDLILTLCSMCFCLFLITIKIMCILLKVYHHVNHVISRCRACCIIVPAWLGSSSLLNSEFIFNNFLLFYSLSVCLSGPFL